IVELLRATENAFLERDGDPFPDVSAVARPDSYGAEDVSEESVQTEGAEVREVGAPRPFEDARTETVVRAALFLVVEDLIGRVDGRESSLRVGIPRVAIGVVLGREAPKSASNFGVVGASIDAEDLVGIPHASRIACRASCRAPRTRSAAGFMRLL